jgi:hypothetical protein
VVPPTAAAIKQVDALQDIAILAKEAQPPTVPSPRFSFKGYDPMVWLSKNAAFVKTTGAAILTALGAQQWKIALAGVAVIAGRWALDAGQYFFTENPA